MTGGACWSGYLHTQLTMSSNIEGFSPKNFLMRYSSEVTYEDIEFRVVRGRWNWCHCAKEHVTELFLNETENILSTMWCCSILHQQQLLFFNNCSEFELNVFQAWEVRTVRGTVGIFALAIVLIIRSTCFSGFPISPYASFFFFWVTFQAWIIYFGANSLLNKSYRLLLKSAAKLTSLLFVCLRKWLKKKKTVTNLFSQFYFSTSHVHWRW